MPIILVTLPVRGGSVPPCRYWKGWDRHAGLEPPLFGHSAPWSERSRFCPSVIRTRSLGDSFMTPLPAG